MQITSNHFGGHALASIHTTDAGGPLERFVDQIEFSSIRYPGGTITERIAMAGRWLDLFADESQGSGDEKLVTVREIQEFAAEKDLTIQFVLPTFSIFEIGDVGNRSINEQRFDEVLNSVRDLLAGNHGPVRIEHLSIGNEWWSGDPNFGSLNMSASEYGALVNRYLEELPTIIDETTGRDDGPKIAVQAGVGFRPNSNEEILAEISFENRAEIDSVIQHFYPRTYDTAADRQLLFDLANQMASAPGMVDPEFLVSEWNVHAASDGDRGMLHAHTILQAFDTMLANNVTNANVWGTNYKFLETRLAEMSHNHWDGVAPDDISIRLTPAGHVFRIMARELPGTHKSKSVLNDKLAAEPDLYESVRLNSYESEDKSVTFISSRNSEEIIITVDLDTLAPNGEHIWVRVFNSQDDPNTIRDEGIFDSHHAMAQFRTLNRLDLERNPDVHLEPGGFAVVTVTNNEEIGAWLEGDHQVIDPDFNYSDKLIGTSGDDKLFGWHGDDTLLGGGGRDILDSGSGRNFLFGEEGEDLLISRGSEDNAILGHGDTIIAKGDNVSVQSKGDDTFIFALSGEVQAEIEGSASIFVSNGASVEISGFNPERDLLAVEGEPEQQNNWLAGANKDDDDLIFSWDDASVRLIGMANRLGEIMEHRFAARDQEELETIFADTIGPMSFMQRTVLARELSGDDFGTSLLGLAPEVPEPTSGFGRRVDDSADKPRDPELTANGEEIQDNGNHVRSKELEEADDVGPHKTTHGIKLLESADEQEDELDEEDSQEQRETKLDGSCFVATAAYRDPGHPDVVYLRAFRDNWLVHRGWGRSFIKYYWKFGPRAAVLVRNRNFLAISAKAMIAGIVVVLKICMKGRI